VPCGQLARPQPPAPVSLRRPGRVHPGLAAQAQHVLHLHDREVGLPRAAVLALSFALIAYGNQWSFYDGTIMGVLTIAGSSYKFYGMLLLGGVLAGMLLEDLTTLIRRGIVTASQVYIARGAR
jgi:hypothetical protein